MTGDALTQEQKDELFKEAEEATVIKPVKRKLVGGPLAGQSVVIPSNQKTNDIGWWTQHYVLQDDGTMKFEMKPEVKEPAGHCKGFGSK